MPGVEDVRQAVSGLPVAGDFAEPSFVAREVECLNSYIPLAPTKPARTRVASPHRRGHRSNRPSSSAWRGAPLLGKTWAGSHSISSPMCAELGDRRVNAASVGAFRGCAPARTRCPNAAPAHSFPPDRPKLVRERHPLSGLRRRFEVNAGARRGHIGECVTGSPHCRASATASSASGRPLAPGAHGRVLEGFERQQTRPKRGVTGSEYRAALRSKRRVTSAGNVNEPYTGSTNTRGGRPNLRGSAVRSGGDSTLASPFLLRPVRHGTSALARPSASSTRGESSGSSGRAAKAPARVRNRVFECKLGKRLIAACDVCSIACGPYDGTGCVKCKASSAAARWRSLRSSIAAPAAMELRRGEPSRGGVQGPGE